MRDIAKLIGLPVDGQVGVELGEGGQGVFQVQRRGAGEGYMYPPGPWRAERRFRSLPEARAYIRENPVDWTDARIICSPDEVEAALAGAK